MRQSIAQMKSLSFSELLQNVRPSGDYLERLKNSVLDRMDLFRRLCTKYQTCEIHLILDGQSPPSKAASQVRRKMARAKILSSTLTILKSMMLFSF